jgi:hypothetical protein
MARKTRKRRCVTHKKRFETQELADRFILDANSGPGLFLLGYTLERAYKCTKCKGWHVTSETLEQYERQQQIGNEKSQTESIRTLETETQSCSC